ncbi:hypothetical protein GUITHDRAFT_117174 [Guillardia theta CCMP2712]|uniref:Uncharacterized protein n=1 Tax=Guillardia theta (strain CCMP2712) TaxID=905079 RepID=L1IL43_GUITC|nr:hypothetical protein GUITHDRAFT_117174 [Guillardia theta CCMP2712]EKX36629.1 hypothetical protein GUITHDRAFT_117174 [Guillardia theta CCMP2712]|eukprot:XP_005823609.1 hypothetical protein GUITHDRAFT_117174 [Guillardia theta CCMP2712]
MVLTIYSTRTNDKRKKTAKSEEVAKEFGVTAKAIRDIWNRRTWWNVTRRIAGEDEISEFESDEEQDDDDEENSDCESTDDCDIEADARDGGISSSTADCATHSQHLKFRSRQLSMDDLFEEALKHVVQR